MNQSCNVIYNGYDVDSLMTASLFSGQNATMIRTDQSVPVETAEYLLVGVLSRPMGYFRSGLMKRTGFSVQHLLYPDQNPGRETTWKKLLKFNAAPVDGDQFISHYLAGDKTGTLFEYYARQRILPLIAENSNLLQGLLEAELPTRSAIGTETVQVEKESYSTTRHNDVLSVSTKLRTFMDDGFMGTGIKNDDELEYLFDFWKHYIHAFWCIQHKIPFEFDPSSDNYFRTMIENQGLTIDHFRMFLREVTEQLHHNTSLSYTKGKDFKGRDLSLRTLFTSVPALHFPWVRRYITRVYPCYVNRQSTLTNEYIVASNLTPGQLNRHRMDGEFRMTNEV